MRVVFGRAGLGNLVLMASVLLVLCLMGASLAMKAAATDLYAMATSASRTEPGTWLSARLAPDVPTASSVTIEAQADTLNHRGDRLREEASVAALAGLVVAVLAGASGSTRNRNLEETSPAASTTRNGTV